MSRTQSIAASRFARTSTTAVAVVTLILATAGCGSFTGPGIRCTAPRMTGRVVDASSDTPIAWAKVGREIGRWRGPMGDFPKGAEDQVARSTWVRTGRDGRFDLSAVEVALVFGFGNTMPNLRLVVDHGAYRRLETNFNTADLKLDAGPPAIDAGTLRLVRK
ncbi:MAG: hypothetical protein DVB31_09955 [Verrucomicrobia bacterium]|nr:MAG: hypothetical protein DVB31_09955 [Verrucomicrobiota bacterium]